MLDCRRPNGAFAYDLRPVPRSFAGESIDTVKGALGRIQVCHWALTEVGDASVSVDDLRRGLGLFFAHHEFLATARMRPIPHEGHYANAGYFFLFGHEYAGLFSNDDELAGRLVAAGRATGDKLWRMPLGDVFDRMIDSDAADMKNIAGDRGAGSTIGAVFIQRFVNNVPWAHLDIAGMAWTKKDHATTPKGATAFGVRLLDRLVAAHYEEKGG